MLQSGPRIGWTLGSLGSLIWIPAMAVFMLHYQMTVAAVINLLILALGITHLWFNAPWKRPDTKIRVLYLGMAGLLMTAAVNTALAILMAFSWDWNQVWWLAFLLTLIFPAENLGNKTWRDMHGDAL